MEKSFRECIRRFLNNHYRKMVGVMIWTMVLKILRMI